MWNKYLGKRCILWKMNDYFRDGDNCDTNDEADNNADDENNNDTITTTHLHCLPLIYW